MTSTFPVSLSVTGTDQIDVNFVPDACPWCEKMGDMKFIAGCIYEMSADKFAHDIPLLQHALS